MLDPLTSLGLASNIVQLVEFGLTVASKGRELASTGTTAEHEHLKVLTRDTRVLCYELDRQVIVSVGSGGTSTDSENEKAIKHVARKTKDAAEELDLLLQSLKLQDPEAGSERPPKRRRTAISRLAKGL